VQCAQKPASILRFITTGYQFATKSIWTRQKKRFIVSLERDESLSVVQEPVFHSTTKTGKRKQYQGNLSDLNKKRTSNQRKEIST